MEVSVTLINELKYEDPVMQILQRVYTDYYKENAMEELLDQYKRVRKSSKEPLGSLALSAFFAAYIFYGRGNLILSIQPAQIAVNEFGLDGKTTINQAIARWFLGTLYQETGQAGPAATELYRASNILAELAKLSESESKYKTRDKYLQLQEMIREASLIPAKFKISLIPELLPTKKPRIKMSKMALFPWFEKKRSSKRASSERLPPQPPKNNQPDDDGKKIAGEGGGGLGSGNNEGMHPLPSSGPSIEINIPVALTLSNLTKIGISSEISSPIDANLQRFNTILSAEQSKPEDRNNLGMQNVDELEELSLPWLPVVSSPTAQANPQGKGYAIQGNDESPTEISHITIEGQLCLIHLVKKTTIGTDRLLNLISSRKYRWMKVSGDSMKDFRPKIEHGDYVLFYDLESSLMEDADLDLLYDQETFIRYDGHSPQPNPLNDNVVIVRQVIGLTHEVRLLIKDYNKSDNLLYSHNHEKESEYAPIPVCEDCQIVGIVVAVARPIK